MQIFYCPLLTTLTTDHAVQVSIKFCCISISAGFLGHFCLVLCGFLGHLSRFLLVFSSSSAVRRFVAPLVFQFTRQLLSFVVAWACFSWLLLLCTVSSCRGNRSSIFNYIFNSVTVSDILFFSRFFSLFIVPMY